MFLSLGTLAQTPLTKTRYVVAVDLVTYIQIIVPVSNSILLSMIREKI
jgi:hypothetical protein